MPRKLKPLLSIVLIAIQLATTSLLNVAPSAQAATVAPPASVLPAWFAAASTDPRDNVLPPWFVAGQPVQPVNDRATTQLSVVLPSWFAPPAAPPVSPPAAPVEPLNEPPSTYAAPIPGLEVTPTAPDSASAGNFYGDTYTVTIRNPCNPITGTNFYITATIPVSGFAYVEGSAIMTSSMSGAIAVTDSYTDPLVIWTPVLAFDLHPCEVLTLTFDMTTDGNAISGQRLDVNAVYENPLGDPGSTNGGVNVTVGRGNLFVEKSPSIQDATYGDVISWTVQVGNTGLGTVYSTTVYDVFGAGYTNTNASELSIPPFHLDIGDRRNFVVTATVNSCNNLTDTAFAHWSIGNDEGDGIPSNPVSDTTDVAYLLQAPDINLSSHNIAFEYCNPTPKTVVVTVTNNGGPALDFALDSNVVSSLPFTVGNVNSDWNYNSTTGVFTYTANSGVIASSQQVTLSFVVTPTFDVCTGAGGNGAFNFEAQYKNPCDLAFSGPSVNASYSYGDGNFPDLDIQKTSSDGTVFTGDTLEFYIDFDVTNIQSISDTIVITDNVPAAFSVTNVISNIGTISRTGSVITWTIPTPGTGDLSGRMTVTAEVVDVLGECEAYSARTNTAYGSAQVTCPTCPPLTDSDSAQVIIQNGTGVALPKSASSDFQVCGLITMTNRYSVTVSDWNGVVFTETLGANDGVPADDVPPGTLNYMANTLSVVVSGTDVTAEVVISQTSPQLVLDFSGITLVPTSTQNMAIAITYSLYISDDVLSGQPEISFFDWSEFIVPGTGGGGSCTGNNTFHQGVDVTLRRADLQIDISPDSFIGCATVPVVLTVSDPDLVARSLVAENIVVSFTVGSPDFGSIDTNFVYGGGFAGNPVAVISGGNVITWTFQNPLTQTGTTTGTIGFTMTRGCGANPMAARVRFDDRCGVAYGDTDTNTDPVEAPEVHLFVTPDTYVVNENKARWRMYVTNVGDGPAGRVAITDALGTGLRFISYTTDFPTQVNRLTAAPFAPGQDIAWEVLNLAPGQQVRFDIYADVVACDGLTSLVTMDASCLDGSCPSSGTDALNFLLPGVAVRSSNDQTADLPFCDTGIVELTVKNASVSAHVYQMVITETISALNYISGSTRITVTDRYNTPYPDLISVPFEPVTSPVGGNTVMVWSLSNPGINITQTRILTDRAPEDSIIIHYRLQTDCDSPGANWVQAEAGGLHPCGAFFFRRESAVTLDVAEPEISLSKGGRNVTKGDAAFAATVYAEPGDTIVWRVTANNVFGANIAQNVVITDVAPTNFIVTDAATTTLGGGTIITASDAVTWDMGLLPADGANRILLITGTVTALPDSCQLETTNRASLQYGCDDGCRSEPIEATAELRTRPSMGVQISPLSQFHRCGDLITVTLENNGPPAYDVTLTDTLPTGFFYQETVFSSTTPTTLPVVGSTVPTWTWTSGISLPTGVTTLTFRVNSGTGGACSEPTGGNNLVEISYDDIVVCTASGPYTATGSSPVSIVSPTLEIEKTPAFQTADAGDVVTWTIRVDNTGATYAPNVLITDTVGSGFTDTTILASNGLIGGQVVNTPTVVGSVITWTPAITIAAGGTWSAVVTATVRESGAQTNTVEARGTCAAGCLYATVGDEAYVTLLQGFDKGPEVQTGTIGSLVVFTLTTTLPDESALYGNLTLTDTLPAGLGYIASRLVYTHSGPPGTQAISNTPTVTPGWLTSGGIVWTLGDLPGTVQIDGVITAAIQNTPTNQGGVRLTNILSMTYTDDGQPYVFTDTAEVDVLEPLLHIGKSYVTPYGCDATLFLDNFNDDDANGWTGSGGWNVTIGSGVYATTNDNSQRYDGDTGWTDYSFSAMMRADDAAEMGLYFRRDGTDYYRLRWRNTPSPRLRFETFVGGASVRTQDLNIPYEPGRWYHVEIRGQGDLVSVFIDGQLTFTDTNATLTSGQIGLFAGAGSGTRTFDDILVTRMDEVACTVGANDPVTYTLVVSNQARLAGYDLVITDTLPNGMSFVTSTLSSSDPTAAVVFTPTVGATDVLTWGINHLTPTVPFSAVDHTALTLTVVLAVSDGITANVTLPNQASLWYDNWEESSQPVDVDRGYSGGSHSTAVRTVDGALIKSVDNPISTTIGHVITYHIVVPSPAITATLYDATVSDTLDSRLQLLSISGPGGAVQVTGNAFTVTYASIPHGQQQTITITASISDPLLAAAGDAITNLATLTHTHGGPTPSNVVTTTVHEPDLTLVKDADPPGGSVVREGDAITYTITLTNTNDPDASPAYDLVVWDTLPNWMRTIPPTVLSLTIDGSSVTTDSQSYDGVSGRLTLTLTPGISLPVGGRLVLSYVAQVDIGVPAGLSLTNRAQASYSSLPGDVPDDRDYVTNDDQETHYTPIATDLLKFVTPTTVTVGSQVVYTYQIPSPMVGAVLPNVIFTDVIPSNLTVTGVSGDGGFVSGWSGGNLVTGTVASIPAFSFVVITVTTTVRDIVTNTDGTVITNTATMDYSSNPGPPPESNVVTITIRWADIAISKAVTPPVVASGERVTFTLTYSNIGPVPAADVVITDTLPAGLSYLSAAPGPAGVNGQVITWSLGTLDAGANGSIQLIATVDATSTTYAVLTNTVVITTATPETDDTNNDDEVPVVLTQTCDLSIVKSARPPSVVSLDRITYTLAYANAGPADAENAVVTDTLPAGLTFDGCAPGACGVAGQVVTWSLGSVSAGASGVLTLYATVDVTGALSAAFTNTVVITTTTDDRDPDNNDDEETTPLTQTIGLEVLKWAEPATVANGQTLTYTVRLRNTGDVPLNPVALTDTLPAGFLYANSATPMEPDAISGLTQTWFDVTAGAGLAAGTSLTVTFRATVDVGTGITGTYVNHVTATGTYPSDTITDTEDAPVDVVQPSVNVVKSLAEHNRDAGIVTFTVQVINTGPSALEVIPLHDVYDPTYLGFRTASPTPDEPVDDGRLDWYDLTSAPNGFDANLPPGERFTLTVAFGILRDITTTVNTVVITSATDVYHNPTTDEDDDEVIEDTPTVVELLYFRATPLPGSALLEWATAVEIDHYGFFLLRSTTANLAEAKEIAFVPAAGHGRSSGAVYSYKDSFLEPGAAYTYWLVDVDTAGKRTVHAPVTVAALPEQPWRVYLPTVWKSR